MASKARAQSSADNYRFRETRREIITGLLIIGPPLRLSFHAIAQMGHESAAHRISCLAPPRIVNSRALKRCGAYADIIACHHYARYFRPYAAKRSGASLLREGEYSRIVSPRDSDEIRGVATNGTSLFSMFYLVPYSRLAGALNIGRGVDIKH